MKLYINYKRINGISKDEKEESIKKELIKNYSIFLQSLDKNTIQYLLNVNKTMIENRWVD